MNLQKTVALMFPHGVVTQTIADSDSFFEVQEISENTVPQNCAVLASGEFQYFRGQDRIGSFLVQAEEHVFFIRVHSIRSGGSHAEITPRYGFDPVKKLRAH